MDSANGRGSKERKIQRLEQEIINLREKNRAMERVLESINKWIAGAPKSKLK